MIRAALCALGAALLVAGCGGSHASAPTDDPGAFAVRVVGLIVHNRYTQAWRDLHPTDRKVASLQEYVGCENRSPVLTVPLSMRVVRVRDQSVGLGDGKFVASKAVDVRLHFTGGTLVHTVHIVAAGGKWTWILPSWRFRDYKADKCPTDVGSSPPPATA